MEIECLSCFAEFDLKPTNGDTEDLEVQYCPYCGCEIIAELNFDGES